MSPIAAKWAGGRRHDNEHSRQADYTGVSAQAAEDKPPAATSNPFADLKSLLGKVPPKDG